MDSLLLIFYCNDNCYVRYHKKKNTTKVPYFNMSLHYTCCSSCIKAWRWIALIQNMWPKPTEQNISCVLTKRLSFIPLLNHKEMWCQKCRLHSSGQGPMADFANRVMKLWWRISWLTGKNINLKKGLGGGDWIIHGKSQIQRAIIL